MFSFFVLRGTDGSRSSTIFPSEPLIPLPYKYSMSNPYTGLSSVPPLTVFSAGREMLAFNNVDYSQEVSYQIICSEPDRAPRVAPGVALRSV